MNEVDISDKELKYIQKKVQVFRHSGCNFPVKYNFLIDLNSHYKPNSVIEGLDYLNDNWNYFSVKVPLDGQS